MVSKSQEARRADFDAPCTRWLAAQDGDDPVELKAAAADLPMLNARLLQRLAGVDNEQSDPDMRAALKRALVFASEHEVEARRRQHQRQQAAERRRDRTVRLERNVELPTTCARCGQHLDGPTSTGRPRLFCFAACRKAAYEDRRSHREGAVRVQVVEKAVTEVRERRVDVPHPRSQCIDAVLRDDRALIASIRTLAERVSDYDQDAFGTDCALFWDLDSAVEVLHEAVVLRTTTDQRGMAVPVEMNRHQRNMARMTHPAAAPEAEQ
jgi:hypothetical protein